MNKLSLVWHYSWYSYYGDYCLLDYIVDGKPLAKLLSTAANKYRKYKSKMSSGVEIRGRSYFQPGTHPLHSVEQLTQMSVLSMQAKRVLDSFIDDHSSSDYDKYVEQLLAIRSTAEFKDGRVPLYTDIQENEYFRDAICVSITRSGDNIEWSEFRYYEEGYFEPSDYDDPDSLLEGDDHSDAWANVGPFIFNYAEYESCLRNPPMVPGEMLVVLRP
jgi:hypothetical protein